MTPQGHGLMAIERSRSDNRGHDDVPSDPRRAITDRWIVCLICAKAFRQLTNTHLRTHAITTAEYKRRFGYNAGRALMAQALRRLYADRAVRVGLATKIRARPIVIRPELRRLGGQRAVALEERLTRQEARWNVYGKQRIDSSR